MKRNMIFSSLLMILVSVTAAPATASIVGQPAFLVLQVNGGTFVPIANPIQIVSDTAVEWNYQNPVIRLEIDLSDTGMVITETRTLLPFPVVNGWQLSIFFTAAGVDWLSGLTEKSQNFNPSLFWAIPSPNQLFVRWDGGILPAAGLSAEFAAAAVPVPASVWLLGSGLLGVLGVGRRRAR